jgi:hypothetical protein
MLFAATVMKFQTVKADRDRRVRDTTTGTSFLLNTNRVTGIRAMTDTAYSSLYYIENPFDNREHKEYMELHMTVAAISTQINTTPTYLTMTLPEYPKMDSTKSTVNTIIPIQNFAWAVAVADSGSATDSIVYYIESGFKLKRARVALTLVQLLALIA